MELVQLLRNVQSYVFGTLDEEKIDYVSVIKFAYSQQEQANSNSNSNTVAGINGDTGLDASSELHQQYKKVNLLADGHLAGLSPFDPTAANAASVKQEQQSAKHVKREVEDGKSNGGSG